MKYLQKLNCCDEDFFGVDIEKINNITIDFKNIKSSCDCRFPGIYFIHSGPMYEDEEILYIGRSINIYNEIYKQLKGKYKTCFYTIFPIEQGVDITDDELLDILLEVQKKAIADYSPRDNKNNFKGYIDNE